MNFAKSNDVDAIKFLKTDFSKHGCENCEINWNVDENKYYDTSEKLRKPFHSPTFPDDNNANFKWQISMQSFGNKRVIQPYSCFFLILKWRKFEIPVSALISMVIKNKSEIIFEKPNMEFKFEECTGYEIFKHLEMQFGIYEIQKYTKIFIKISASYENNNYKLKQNLFHNYSSLLKDDTFSDLTLCVEEDKTEFNVHRNILACRSKVFATMLFKEKHNLKSRIVIKDFSSSIIKEMLNFIYSCKVEFKSVDETSNLLKIAEKYDLTDLTNLCNEYLFNSISENNACNILLQANVYNLHDLKTAILKFMYENKKIFSDPTKCQILKKDPELLLEILAKFSNDNE